MSALFFPCPKRFRNHIMSLELSSAQGTTVSLLWGCLPSKDFKTRDRTLYIGATAALESIQKSRKQPHVWRLEIDSAAVSWDSRVPISSCMLKEWLGDAGYIKPHHLLVFPSLLHTSFFHSKFQRHRHSMCMSGPRFPSPWNRKSTPTCRMFCAANAVNDNRIDRWSCSDAVYINPYDLLLFPPLLNTKITLIWPFKCLHNKSMSAPACPLLWKKRQHNDIICVSCSTVSVNSIRCNCQTRKIKITMTKSNVRRCFCLALNKTQSREDMGSQLPIALTFDDTASTAYMYIDYP